MAQLKQTDRDSLDRALDAVDLDIFAVAKGVVEQKERSGENIADQGLRAESDDDADDACTGEDRSDVEAEARQHDHRRNGKQDDDHHVTHDGQKSCHARRAGSTAFATQFFVIGFGRSTFLFEPFVDEDGDGPIRQPAQDGGKDDVEQ